MKYLYRLILFVPNLILFTLVIALRLSMNANFITNDRRFIAYCGWMDDKCDLYDKTIEV